MRAVLLVAVIFSLSAYADTVAKDEGVRLGPINTIDCVGGGVTCTRSGSTMAVTVSPGAAAPTDADYLVKTANASLSAERVVTDTSSVTWDWSSAGLAKANVVTPVATATALSANGSNCSSGSYPLGVDAAGNVETCTSIPLQRVNATTTSNATTTFVNVTRLTWDLNPNVQSDFVCHLIFQSTSAAVGIAFAVNGTSTANQVDYFYELQNTANKTALTTTARPWIHAIAFATAADATAAVDKPNVNYSAFLTGSVINGESSSTISIQFKSSAATSVSVRAGSWCFYTTQ
jgi:hypothetical protein